ncbi:hypothetical protein [Microbacterium sp. Leaf320]|nr:hypothetical protein [Microbacterium sp. Leaf320]
MSDVREVTEWHEAAAERLRERIMDMTYAASIPAFTQRFTTGLSDER